MRVVPLALLATLLPGASGDERPALALRARTEFGRVELAAVPRLEDAAACQQSQAAVLPLASREEVPLVHYRKGFCSLAGASLTGSAAQFAAAAGEFQKAIQAWPARAAAHSRDVPPEPVPSALPVLAAIARLHANPSPAAMDAARRQIADAEAAADCPAGAIPAAACRGWLATGRAWLGWMALGQENLDQAARDFSAFAGSGWPVWISGLRAFREAKYSQAETDYARALEAWRRAAREPAPSLDARLAPHPDMASALADLGGAELLAGHPESAIATLDQAVNAAPAGARALYLRARAREKAGAAEAALADYNLASRTAFAQARDLASGEAHFYRGILLYRRKDYARAEDEFSSALNFEIPASLRADAAAWRHLAAVAGGACGISRQFLMRVLGSVSPYFPKEEAAALLSACRAGGPAGAAPPK